MMKSVADVINSYKVNNNNGVILEHSMEDYFPLKE